MARPPRVNVSGGWYYVTARGRAGQPVFREVTDGADFLARVEELTIRFGVEVHAFVLLPDHYHLLLRTPRGNLSRAVQWLNTGYGIWCSRRRPGGGRVFQGRFKSVLAEEGSWPLELSLHLHANPAVVKRASADPAGRLDVLSGWKWSSYRAYAGLQSIPAWLTVAPLRSRVADGAAGYARLVEARVGADLVASPWAQVRRGALPGRAAFVEVAAGRPLPARAPALSAAAGDAQWGRIVAWVEARCGQPWAHLCTRRGEWGRELAWWAGRRFAELSLKDLGARAGGVHAAAVAKALERFTASLASQPARAGAASALALHLQVR